MRKMRHASFLVLGMITATVVLLAAGCSSPARADDAGAAPDSLQSYWGTLPAPSDSVTGRFQDRSPSFGEHLLLAPYRIISTPVGVVNRGIVRTIVFFAETLPVRPMGQALIGFNFTAGGALGTGGGFSLTKDGFAGEHNRLKFRWQSTTNSSHKLSLAMMVGADRPTTLQFGGGWRVRPNARYYGIGPGTIGRDESLYLNEVTWGGASLGRQLGGDFTVELSGTYSGVNNRGPETDEPEPRLEDLFAAELPVGWGSRSDGLEIGLELNHDNTTERGRPERGGLRRFKVSLFNGKEEHGDVKFTTYRAELQQFLPLWFTRRSLALRGVVSWLDNRGTDPIPFQRLLTNDEPDLLRGYKDYRWRDEGIIAFTAEYRWAIWTFNEPRDTGMDAYLFTDVGQVFSDTDQINGDNLKSSFGGGLRLIGNDGSFAGRLEIAVSEEETLIRLRGDQLFQFSKGGIFHGRDPVPTR